MSVTEADLRKLFVGADISDDLVVYILWAIQTMESIPWAMTDQLLTLMPHLVTTEDLHNELGYPRHVIWTGMLMQSVEDLVPEPEFNDTGTGYVFLPNHLDGHTWLWVHDASATWALQLRSHADGHVEFVVVDIDEGTEPFIPVIDDVPQLIGVPAFNQDDAAEGCWEPRHAAYKAAIEEEKSEDEADEAGYAAEEDCINYQYEEWLRAALITLKVVAKACHMTSDPVYVRVETGANVVTSVELTPKQSWATVAALLAWNYDHQSLLTALRGGERTWTPYRYIEEHGLKTLFENSGLSQHEIDHYFRQRY